MEEIIKLYIKREGAVRIGGLGTLSLAYRSSELHPVVHKFTIPGKYVIFKGEENAKTDASFLIFVAGECQVELSEAEKQVNDFVEKVKSETANGKEYEVGTIGKFIRNGIGKLDFEGKIDTDLSPESFGLENFEIPNIHINKGKNIFAQAESTTTIALKNETNPTTTENTQKEISANNEKLITTEKETSANIENVENNVQEISANNEKPITTEKETPTNIENVENNIQETPANEEKSIITEEETPASEEEQQPEPAEKDKTTKDSETANAVEESVLSIHQDKPKRKGCHVFFIILLLILLSLVVIMVVFYIAAPHQIAKMRDFVETKFNIELFKDEDSKSESSNTNVIITTNEKTTIFYDENLIDSTDIEPAEEEMPDFMPEETPASTQTEQPTQEQSPASIAPNAVEESGYYIVMGSFSTEANAEKFVSEKSAEYPAVKNIGQGKSSKLYLVGLGPYSESEAKQLLANKSVKGWLLKK